VDEPRAPPGPPIHPLLDLYQVVAVARLRFQQWCWHTGLCGCAGLSHAAAAPLCAHSAPAAYSQHHERARRALWKAVIVSGLQQA